MVDIDHGLVRFGVIQGKDTVLTSVRGLQEERGHSHLFGEEIKFNAQDEKYSIIGWNRKQSSGNASWLCSS